MTTPNQGRSNSVPGERLIVLQILLGLIKAIDAITPYGLLRSLNIISSYRHVEMWVIAWVTIVVAASVLISYNFLSPLYVNIVCAFGTLRVIEIIMTQCKTVFLIPDGSGRSPHSIYSLRRTLVLSMINYFEIVLWFAIYHAILVANGSLSIASETLLSYMLLLRESLIEMVGNSSGLVSATDYYGWLILVAQPIIGFFMVSIVIGRFISFLPKPTTSDLEERELGTGD